MFDLRIKQAETALAEGRLEEAFEILRQAEARSTKWGQELIGNLVEALVARGREHLAAGRLPQAQADAERAVAIGGNMTHVAQLRAAVAHAVESTQRRERRAAQLLAAAKQQIDHGRLSVGQRWLEGIPDGESRVAMLMRDVDVKKSTLETALAAAIAANDRDDLGVAVRETISARDADGGDERVHAICAKVAEKMKTRLSAFVDSGRLDLAESMTLQLAALCGETGDVQQFRRGIEQCRTAWKYLDAGQTSRAAEILRRAALIFPTASWIEKALEHVKQADLAMAELRGGPLALLADGAGSNRVGGIPSAMSVQQVKIMRHGPQAHVTPQSTSLPSRFILRVDGIGSFCVFRQPILTIGPISSSQQPDLALLAEAAVPIATIERREDEYFIRGSAVAVNERPGTGKLLASGDRIALSPRCRMNFILPSAASTTAVLDLNGCRYPRGDVRRVILLDGDVILGPGAATHVRVDDAEQCVILHVRGGRLFAESKTAIEVDGSPMDRISGIPMDAHVKAGGVSFVVSES